MTTIVETLLEVGKALLGLKGRLAAARGVRKQVDADFLGDIAQSIEEASALLKEGTYPHGKCQELLAHSGHMVTAIGDLVGQDRAKELGEQLAEVHQIERLHAELGAAGVDRVRELSVLDQAAGQFRATAAF